LPRDDLRRLARLWGVVLEDSVLETPTGCVAFGRRGEDCVVLKIPRPENDETHSLAALLHFAGSGAVRVLEHGPGAMLLERAIPGRPLTDLVIASCDDEATGIICDLIAALHRPALPADAVNQFPSIEDWGSELKSYRNDAGAIPFNLLDRAVALFAELASSQGPRRLLHGDLHHHNILYDQHRGWVAIDPKGVVGESPYEIGSALRNPTQDPAVLPWRQSSSGGSPSWASACNSIATASWHGRLHKPFCRRFGAFKTVAIRAAAWQLLTPFFPCCSRFLPRTLSVAAGPPYVVAEQIERNAWITTGTMTPTSAASSIP